MCALLASTHRHGKISWLEEALQTITTRNLCLGFSSKGWDVNYLIMLSTPVTKACIHIRVPHGKGNYTTLEIIKVCIGASCALVRRGFDYTWEAKMKDDQNSTEDDGYRYDEDAKGHENQLEFDRNYTTTMYCRKKA